MVVSQNWKYIYDTSFSYIAYIPFYTPPHSTCITVSLWLSASVCMSVCPASVFLFLEVNLSMYQWVVTKLGICIDIVEIWCWIANGQWT